MKEPSFIIKLRGETVHREVTFQELYALHKEVINMTMLWDFNSYFIDIEGKYMIVNGGRKLHINNLFDMTNPVLYYRRRHQSVMSVAGDSPTKKKTAYVLGAYDDVREESKRVYILIEANGSEARIIDNEANKG